MSNPILSSNQSSAVVATINESTTKNPWVYNETDRLTVPHALQLLNIQSSSGQASANTTVTFDLPKNGLLQQLFVKITGGTHETYGENDNEAYRSSDDAQPFDEHQRRLGFLSTIASIRLTASGRIIEKLDRQQLLARIADMPPAYKQSVEASMFMTRPVEGFTSTVATMPIPFYFSRDQQRYGLLTNFEEPFRVEIQFGSDDDMKLMHVAGGTGSVLVDGTLQKVELIGHYRQLDEPQMNEIVSKNYGDGLLSRIVDISKREAVHDVRADKPAMTDSTVLTERMQLKENEAVRAMYVMLCPQDGPNHLKGAPAPIEEIELRFNNSTVLNVPATLLRYYGRWGQSTDLASGSVGLGQMVTGCLQYVYKIDFGLGYDKGLSNVVAMREISNPELVVKFRWAHDQLGTLGKVTEYKLHVVYDTATFLSTSSSTGRVQLSISS